MRDIARQSFNTVHADTASATGATNILASNPSRCFATLWNDSTAVLTLRFAAAADFTGAGDVAVAVGGYYELPAGYVGPLSGKWATANGFARTAEFV